MGQGALRHEIRTYIGSEFADVEGRARLGQAKSGTR